MFFYLFIFKFDDAGSTRDGGLGVISNVKLVPVLLEVLGNWKF